MSSEMMSYGLTRQHKNKDGVPMYRISPFINRMAFIFCRANLCETSTRRKVIQFQFPASLLVLDRLEFGIVLWPFTLLAISAKRP